ncbi:hypothetical protein RHAL1_00593 [Beijerinckiaceae bacterium RH AL1]|nr:hypothetical protein RHAL8_00562 [Beijerinckiaceae bacterium RH AL8]VVB43195.1 hypothetical protein RHCH11_RHCH11_00564 [Beijerinckiaceae bacterium RH CH11]VVC53711.1 hypothetical protein RHAL1_00593 [Beijerinckiaceae bacterium RH AL1]
MPQPGKALSTLFQSALAHHQSGDFVGAEHGYRALLAIDPSQAMVWSNLAAVLHETGRNAEALQACREALRRVPDHLNAQLNLATAQQSLGDFAAAASTFEAILTRHPQRADLRASLAFALERCERGDEAVAIYDRLLEANPHDVKLWKAKAEAAQRLRRRPEAIAAFAEVVRLKPDDPSALSSLGILRAMHSIDNDLDDAAALCIKAAMLEPSSGPIVNNLGVVLNMRGEWENALLVLRELVAQQPTFAPAHSNIGSILSSRSRYDEAQDAFEEALRLDPDLSSAKIELTKIRRHLCDWTTADADARTIRGMAGDGTNFMIVLMAVSASGAEQLAYARSAMAGYQGRRPRRAMAPVESRRLRIGYISADFRDHPIGHLMPDVIRYHDRERFEVFGYSLGAAEMVPLRARFAAAFDHFIDLDKISDADAATRIVRDQIDILIDITGPTAGSRFDILAERPAPVQVSFLGLPGTSGSDAYDYIVADHFLVPDGSQRFFSEAVVRLPHCYQPSDTARAPLAPLPSRAQCGLPEQGFVFCSFNSPVKITPEMFDVWMRLLHAVDGSVLWLYCKADRAKRNLLARAAERGIAPERIVFAPALAFEPYLTRMTLADLFLDTHPYAAGATCNDVLWVGVPVVTCVGETYVSRMAGSLLSTLGLDDLVTTSLEAYERIALRLARDPEALRAVRDRLAAARADSPLFDMPRFTRHLEAAYAGMAATASDGREPAAFDVEA